MNNCITNYIKCSMRSIILINFLYIDDVKIREK